MCSAQQVVLLLATAWVSSSVAIAPCNDEIISGFSQLAECYSNGSPPSQQAGSGSLATYLWKTEGEIPSDVVCATGSQDSTHSYSTFYYPDNKSVANQYNLVPYSNYMEEYEDNSSIKYRLYVTHNEKGAYAYYRCISEGDSGTGSPAAFIATGCKYTTNNVTLEVVAKVKSCFAKLNINLVSAKPCEC